MGHRDISYFFIMSIKHFKQYKIVIFSMTYLIKVGRASLQYINKGQFWKMNGGRGRGGRGEGEIVMSVFAISVFAGSWTFQAILQILDNLWWLISDFPL